jgi:hypothetical protein
MGWLSAPLARIEAIIEGTYPTVPVTGRSLTARTFRATKLHGTLDDPAGEFPAVHFHRGYALLPVESGNIEGQRALNARAGMGHRRALLTLQVGYLFGRESALAGPGAKTAKSHASLLAHEDFDLIEQALVWPAHWGGTAPTMYSVRLVNSVRTRELVAHARLIAEATFEIQVGRVPGAVYT